MRWWHIALPVGIVGAIVATTRQKDDEGGVHSVSDFPEPLYVGMRGDPELEALLTELSDYLTSEGVDVNVVGAAEITKMRKTSGPSYAIPQRVLWRNAVHTLKPLYQPIRWAHGRPITFRNGYRPPDYNAAVGGARGSRHQDFSAFDMAGQSGEATREIALLAAELYDKSGAIYDMGLGIYGVPIPTVVHIDSGWKQRTWGDAGVYVKQVAAKA